MPTSYHYRFTKIARSEYFAGSKTQQVFTELKTPSPTNGMYIDNNAFIFELLKGLSGVLASDICV